MCGRFAVTLAPEVFRQAFGYVEHPNFPPRYNIAPTQPVAIVHEERGERHFRLVRWGFLPSWVKDPKEFPLLINARGETLATKPAFRAALKRRRCVFLADGFYEWRREGRRSVPFLIRHVERLPLPFAGLWETWSSPEGSEIDTAAIVTTAATGAMLAIHDRMPAILWGDAVDRWLDADAVDAKAAIDLIRPGTDAPLELVPIGSLVNKVAHDGPEIQEPLDTGEAQAVPPAPPRRKDPQSGEGGQGTLF